MTLTCWMSATEPSRLSHRFPPTSQPSSGELGLRVATAQ